MSEEQQNKKSLGGRFLTHTLNFGVGSLIPKLISFLLVPVYTIYLEPSDFGIIDIATSFSAFLVIFMRLGVPGSVTRFYFDYSAEDLRDYITTVYIFLLGVSIGIGVIVGFVLHFFGTDILAGVPLYPFLLLTIVTALLSSNSDLQRRLLLAREQSAYSAKLSVAIALVTIGLTILLVIVFRLGALGVLLALGISGFMFFLQAQWYLRPYLKGKWNLDHLKPSLKYGMGVLPSHITASLTPFLSRVLLGSWDSLAAVGVYGIAIRFYSPLQIALKAYSNSVIAIYFSQRKMDEKSAEESLREALSRSWLVFCLLFIGFIWLTPAVIKLLTPEKFHYAAQLTPILALGFLFHAFYTIAGSEIFYSKKTQWLGLMALIGMIANLGFIWFSFDSLGAASLAWGSVLSWLVYAFLAWLYVKRNYKLLLGRDVLWISGLFVGLTYLLQQWSQLNEVFTIWESIGIGLVLSLIYILVLWKSGWINIRSIKKMLKR